MPEALQQVREDLGDEAVILSSRKLRKNNRYNPDDESRVEVTAAFDAEEGEKPAVAPLAARKYASANSGRPKPVPPVENKKAAGGGNGEMERMLGQFRQLGQAIEASQSTEPSPAHPEAAPVASPVVALGSAEASAMDQVLGQLRRLGEAVTRLERRPAVGLSLPDGLSRLVDRLHGLGLSAEVVGRLSAATLRAAADEDLQERQGAGQALLQACKTVLPSRRDIRLGTKGKAVGFVGAAGAGKSTAMAKIAAGFVARRRRADGIVWVSAGEGESEARKMRLDMLRGTGIEVEEAAGAEDMGPILERHNKVRLLLIDTPGCGPHDGRAWQERRDLLNAAQVDEVQVVLDGMTGTEHMLDLIEASEGLPQRRLLFAKMDQVVRPGAVLSAAAASGLPVSYFTENSEPSGGIKPGNLARLLGEALGIAGKGA